LIKYIKSVLWRVAKRLSYIEEARCLKVKDKMGGTCRTHGRYDKPIFVFVHNFYGTDQFGDHGAGFCKKRGINTGKFRLVRTEATVWWRKLHNEKLHDFLSGNTVTRMNKSIKRW